MKKIFVIALLFFGCSNIEFPWDKMTLDDAINNFEKPIMVYFYATW
tara:strand:+ start:462 stop:599 length:138 start_codon:yes stop_codon:yes gene_type:complete